MKHNPLRDQSNRQRWREQAWYRSSMLTAMMLATSAEATTSVKESISFLADSDTSSKN
jgi:hypothetical protein